MIFLGEPINLGLFHAILGIFILSGLVLFFSVWIDKQNLLEFKDFAEDRFGVHTPQGYGVLIPLDPYRQDELINKIIKKCNLKIYFTYLNLVIIVLLGLFQPYIEEFLDKFLNWFS